MMKKRFDYIAAAMGVLLVGGVLCTPLGSGLSFMPSYNTGRVLAAPANSRINKGVFIGDIDVSGMTADEAKSAVNSYVDGLRDLSISLRVSGDDTVSVTAGELGLTWENPEAVDDAINQGKQGNLLRRYREHSGLQSTGADSDLSLTFDENSVNRILDDIAARYDRPGTPAKIRREGGQFIIEGGESGRALDREASSGALKGLLDGDWKESGAGVDLVIKEDKTRGSREDFEQMTDILGTFTTKFTSSGSSRSANVTNGCSKINGTLLYPGEEFSAYKTVSPFSEANGYHMAGSYMNGQVVESLGGGICQVSTTLYNAVLRAELKVVERHNHSMEVNYVDPSADAAIAESAGKDFRFVNSTDAPIYIEGHTQDKTITFTIYGKETRPSNRKLSFESEVLSEIVPEADSIVATSSQGIGYFKSQSVHIGRTAKLWKIIKEGDKEVSREQVNSSTYKAVPRTITVGINSPDPNATAMMQNAIATGSIDHVKAVAASINSGTPLPGTEVPAIPMPEAVPGAVPEGVPAPPGPEVAPVEMPPEAPPEAAGAELAP